MKTTFTTMAFRHKIRIHASLRSPSLTQIAHYAHKTQNSQASINNIPVVNFRVVLPLCTTNIHTFNANCELNNSLPNGSILHLSSQGLPPPHLDFTRRRTDTQCSCITTISPHSVSPSQRLQTTLTLLCTHVY